MHCRSLGAGLIRLAGTTKLAISNTDASNPSKLGYLIFIISNKLLNPEKFLTGTFGEVDQSV
jgi:hypothetical protein